MLKLISAAILACCFAYPSAAEDPPPYPKFTFKRVKPPESGAGKRITVQIDPTATPRVVPDVATVSTPDAAPEPARVASSYDWYWEIISPKLSDTAPGRLTSAVDALNDGPDGQSVRAPRLQQLQNIAAAYNKDILLATVGKQVSPALVLAVMGVESGGNPTAVSSAGATGLMQLMPATAERFGVTDIADAAQNIAGGVTFLDWLVKEFNGDPVLVLAAYNAGEGALRKNDGVPPYAETRDYVPKVLAAWQVARGLCLTPPELISDGCVFRTPDAG